MESIFLIRRKTSDYEGCDSIESFRNSKEEADLVVEDMNRIYFKSLEIIKIYDDEYWKKRHELEELPEFIMEVWEEIPKWKAGIHQKDITKEMREERDRIKKSNDEKNERNILKSKLMSDASKIYAEDYVLNVIKTECIDMRVFESVKKHADSYGFSYLNEYYSQQIYKKI
jgi:hypothetical protein